MSQSEWLDWLHADAMGVLGWTNEEALDTPISAIIAALKSRNRYVRSILEVFTGSDEPKTKQEMTPEMFRAMFG